MLLFLLLLVDLGRSQGNHHHTIVKVDHQHLDNVILAVDVVALLLVDITIMMVMIMIMMIMMLVKLINAYG